MGRGRWGGRSAAEHVPPVDVKTIKWYRAPMKPDMDKARAAHANLKSKSGATPQHGGSRDGAGRKDVYTATDKPVRITIEVSAKEAAKFKQWASRKGLKSHADAFRSIIAKLDSPG